MHSYSNKTLRDIPEIFTKHSDTLIEKQNYNKKSSKTKKQENNKNDMLFLLLIILVFFDGKL